MNVVCFCGKKLTFSTAGVYTCPCGEWQFVIEERIRGRFLAGAQGSERAKQAGMGAAQAATYHSGPDGFSD